MPRDTPIPPAAAQATPVAAEAGGLPRGYRLRDFIIERVLAEGGFGVVYTAIDARLQRRVAIKEYMPAALARRGGDFSVQPRSSVPLQDAFAVGLRSFINEARMLAGFDHPALVRVLQFWEDKGTGFMVMPLYQSPTVRQWTLANAAAPEPAWLEAFIARMLEALELVHGVACLHRDVAPDNILLRRDRDPLLLDFGAARRVIEEMTQTLTAIVKPGFAPVEQYAQSAGLRQGPWTDLYGLCATLHFMLTRRAPPPAVGRMVADDYEPLARTLQGRYPAALLMAIDAGLAVRPADRPQSVAELRSLLTAPTPFVCASLAPVATPDDDANVSMVRLDDPAQSAREDATTLLLPPSAPVGVQAAPPAPAGASRAATVPVTDALLRRPLPARTVVATLVIAVLASAGWVAWRGATPSVSLADVSVSGGLVTQAPMPITLPPGPQPALPSVPAPEPSPVERAAADASTAMATPAADASVPAPATDPTREVARPAMPAPAAEPAAPSAQRLAELARLRDSASRRAEQVTPRAGAALPRIEPPAATRAAESLAATVTPAAQPETLAPAAAPGTVVPTRLQPIDAIHPQFPAEAAREGIARGRVVARLHVAADGSVSQVDIVSSAPRRTFARAVIAAAGQWRYQPPGQPRQVDVEFVFRREE